MSPICSLYYTSLYFPADIGRKPASPARAPREPVTLKRRREPALPGTLTRRLMKRHNMAAPVWTVTDMCDNPKTMNRSGVYIYNGNGGFFSGQCPAPKCATASDSLDMKLFM